MNKLEIVKDLKSLMDKHNIYFEFCYDGSSDMEGIYEPRIAIVQGDNSGFDEKQVLSIDGYYLDKSDLKKATSMTIKEIKEAVDNGRVVHWSNPGYTVVKDSLDQYFIKNHNGDCIGLTNLAGDSLNGEESDFFIKE